MNLLDLSRVGNIKKRIKLREKVNAVGRTRTYAPKGNLISSQTP